MSETEPDIKDQGRHWSRHATQYHEVFLDPYRTEVVNPVLQALEAVPDPGSRSVIDLGCGTGPLLPLLLDRFGAVTALDFAAGMIRKSKARLGDRAEQVTFLNRPMHELEDLAGTIDVAVAVNSIVMPDVRTIDRTLRAVRVALKPGGVFVGAVPAIDAILYHTMLLMDHALDRGDPPEEAERYAAYHAEHTYYDFAFGRFKFQGLRQKFWHGFELEFRLRKAGFGEVQLDKVLYPWDESMYGGETFSDQPRSWDWTFSARP